MTENHPAASSTRLGRRCLVLGALLPAAWTSSGARAALDIGERAPDFTAAAALAGRTFTFSLSQALARGPVVLYFFPAAFSDACSMEAHGFAQAMPQFESLGATVVGVSGDDIDLLSRFSVQACNGKFAVAADDSRSIMKSYDATMQTRPDFANRVSYVIAPNGSIVFVYMSLNPSRHVEKTLIALREWKQRSAR